MTSLGEAFVDVRANTAPFAQDVEKNVKQSLEDAEKTAQKFGTSTKQSFKMAGEELKAFTNRAAKGARVALTGLVGAAGLMAYQAEQAEIANRRLGQVLKSMGYGEATERVSAYAEELERTVAVDGEVIKATQAKLATFKNLTQTVGQAGGAFDRATLAALDLAAAGFGSAETNAVQLGKALQDPVKGLAALGRAGVTFTAQEKEKIKTLVESGQVLEAQNVILQAIEQQVGGTAEATKSDFAAMKIAIENTGESIGTLLLPFVSLMADALQAVAGFAEENATLFVALGGAIGVVAGAIVAANLAMKVWEGLANATVIINRVLGSSFSTLQVSMGVVGLAIAAASALYVAYAGNKSKATDETNDFTDALNLEGAAQQKALQNLLKSNVQSRIAVASLKTQGLALNDVTEYAKTGEGAFKKYVDALTVFDSTTGTTVQKLDAFSKALGITIGLSTEAGGEAAYGLLEMARAAAILRDDAIAANTATQLLAGAGLTGVSKGAGDASRKADELRQKLADLRSELKDQFKPALQAANDVLQTAIDKFNDYAKSVSNVFTGAINAGDAYKSGQDAGKSFLTALTEQGKKVATFGELVNRLLTMGLSEDALQQVLSAGVDAGTAIANELIKGGQDAITGPNGINAIVASAKNIGDQVGLNAASNFYQAGVTTGQSLVDGINSVISKYTVKLRSKKLTAKQLKKLQKDFSVEVAFQFSSAGAEVPELANGAIVRRRTTAVIGEAGPEVVIPISRPARALDLLEASGLANLARGTQTTRGPALNIEQATFVAPVDADLIAQRVLVAERARSF